VHLEVGGALSAYTTVGLVGGAAQVKVKRRGQDIKYIANVLAVGTECDIALLTVEDEGFWEGAEALEFGDLPRLQVRDQHTACLP
jgi:hypothetical protein